MGQHSKKRVPVKNQETGEVRHYGPMTYAGGINMGTQPKIGSSLSTFMYQASRPALPQAKSSGPSDNLQPRQFTSGGQRRSGKVNKGFNPFKYEGGAHREPGRLG